MAKGKQFPELPFQLASGDRWMKDSRAYGKPSFGGKKVKKAAKKGK